MTTKLPCPIRERNKPEVLLDFVAGRLTAAETAALTEHAADCPDCSTFIAEQSKVWVALDGLAVPVVSSDFDAKLYARIATQNRAPWWQRTWNRVFASGEPGSWRPAFAATVACALLVGVAVVRNPAERPIGPVAVKSAPMVPAKMESARVTSVEAADVESIERALEDVEFLRMVTVKRSAI